MSCVLFLYIYIYIYIYIVVRVHIHICIYIYILWWLHNHRNLSIARWSYTGVSRLWAKMASFWEAFLGERFVCCTLTVFIIYNTVSRSIASIYRTSAIDLPTVLYKRHQCKLQMMTTTNASKVIALIDDWTKHHQRKLQRVKTILGTSI